MQQIVLRRLKREINARTTPSRFCTKAAGGGRSVEPVAAGSAAAEGLNLQSTARYLLHFDCPWNPSRLEQRNGRLDRHGQARDVTVHYFVSDQDQDLAFLAHVVRKANEIREDLGSANELFEDAAHRRFIEGESASAVQADLNRRIVEVSGRAPFEADDTTTLGVTADRRLQALAAELISVRIPSATRWKRRSPFAPADRSSTAATTSPARCSTLSCPAGGRL